MAETIPTHTPAGFAQGDLVKWTIDSVVNGDRKDPADGWVLTYALVNASAQTEFSGTDNGDGTHLVTLTAANTSSYSQGVYHYQASVLSGTSRHVVRTGQICVEPDFKLLDSHDAREWAEKVLDAIEATLEGKATSDQVFYSIQGRSLSRMSWESLMDARNRLKREVNSLRQADAIAKGRGHSGIIRTRI